MNEIRWHLTELFHLKSRETAKLGGRFHEIRWHTFSIKSVRKRIRLYGQRVRRLFYLSPARHTASGGLHCGRRRLEYFFFPPKTRWPLLKKWPKGKTKIEWPSSALFWGRWDGKNASLYHFASLSQAKRWNSLNNLKENVKSPTGGTLWHLNFHQINLYCCHVQVTGRCTDGANDTARCHQRRRCLPLQHQHSERVSADSIRHHR